MHASTTLLFFLTWAWLADASAAAAPPSTSPAAASSAAPTSDTLLVTLCSAAYFPGAVQLLASLQEQQADDSIVQLAVLVTPDVNPCMRRLLQTRLNATIIDTAATGWVNRTYGGPRRVTTVHFAKLALLTEPFFRQFRTVVYVDSDMLFREPLQRLVNQTQLADPRAVAFVRVSNPLMTLYREARLPLPESIMHEFPDTPYVFSTRIILLSPQMLESTEEYRQRIEHYLARCAIGDGFFGHRFGFFSPTVITSFYLGHSLSLSHTHADTASILM